MRLSRLVDQLIPELKATGRYRMCDALSSVTRSVQLYAPRNTNLHVVFTRNFLYAYRKYLISSNLCRTTVSFHMAILRSLYSAALELGELEYQHRLFPKGYSVSDRPIKRALRDETTSTLYSAKLDAYPRLKRCLEMFLLSIYLQGMALVDLANLRKIDLDDDTISYCRKKTNTMVQVHVSPQAREILDKYMPQAADSPYLLPLLTQDGAEGYKEYQALIRRFNRQLKQIAELLGIKENLTTYSSRHTFATLAHHNGVNISVVSQAMGHRTEEMTHTYLASFESKCFEEANLTVLNAILRPIEEGRVKSVTVVSPEAHEAKKGGEPGECGESGEHKKSNHKKPKDKHRQTRRERLTEMSRKSKRALSTGELKSRKEVAQKRRPKGDRTKNVRQLVHDGQ